MDLEQFSQDRVEARSVPFTDVDTSNDGWTFEGLAAVYDQEADLGNWTESMARGSFRKALTRGDNVPMLMEHNVDLPVLATTLSGTLSLSDDAKGLRVKANIAQHYVGEAVRELVKRGDIRGMSPGFIAGRGNSKIEHRGSKVHRTIIGFKKILDVSPTWEPAYTGTMAEMRSLRALQMAEDIDHVQQVLSGAAPQLEDRAPVESEPKSEEQETVTPVDEAVCAECNSKGLPACECVTEDEQRSGADTAKAAAAARRRRLQMMGLTIPKDEMWNGIDEVVDHRSERPARKVDEILRYPRETWTAEERRTVNDRRRAVQKEQFALASAAERAGRNFTSEETERFGRLQDEYARLHP